MILALETSTRICSVALTQGTQCIQLREVGGEYSHAEQLNLFILEVLQMSETSWDEIDAIAVASGPGSYTGLRIGVSTAKGLCYALNKPLIAVPSLKAMAYGAIAQNGGGSDALFAPMIDARRMEVYTALFDHKLHQSKETSAVILDKDFFDTLRERNKTVLFFGDGAEKCNQFVRNYENFYISQFNVPSASYIGILADELLKNNEFSDLAYFEPFYLKDFVLGAI